MKLFLDAVHGELSVPRRFCKQIIDTKQFQRLKRIEQSYVSSLFPTATHNRFVHSLGVYHIGSMLFKAIAAYDLRLTHKIEETINKYSTGDIIWREKGRSAYSVLEESFYVACLLHDCGHAPFSHTFETFYELVDGEDTSGENLTPDTPLSLLHSCLNRDGSSRSIRLIDDLRKYTFNDARIIKKHESISSWMVLRDEGFHEAITSGEVHADPQLVARMIMGVPFADPATDEQKKVMSILNCYIALLNGHLVDADRIDYALRDQWASGLPSPRFSLKRLLSSIHIEEKEDNNEYVIVYDKKALSELHCIAEVKNFSNYWIFSHHKFVMLEFQLKRAVTYLAVLLNGKQNEYDDISKKIDSEEGSHIEDRDKIENESLSALFDIRSLYSKKTFLMPFEGNEKNTESIIYPCDDDIIYLLKKYFCIDNSKSILLQRGCKVFNDWLLRSNRYLPVWKSRVEYEHIFKQKLLERIRTLSPDSRFSHILDDSVSDCEPIRKLFKFIAQKAFHISDQEYRNSDLIKALRVEKTVILSTEEIGSRVYVKLSNKLLEYGKLHILHQESGKGYEPFFYLYIDKEKVNKVEDIQNEILKGIEGINREDVNLCIGSSDDNRLSPDA